MNRMRWSNGFTGPVFADKVARLGAFGECWASSLPQTRACTLSDTCVTGTAGGRNGAGAVQRFDGRCGNSATRQDVVLSVPERRAAVRKESVVCCLAPSNTLSCHTGNSVGSSCVQCTPQVGLRSVSQCPSRALAASLVSKELGPPLR